MEKATSPAPDELIVPRLVAIVRYEDAPIALEVVSRRGRRIGIALEPRALAALAAAMQEAAEAESK